MRFIALLGTLLFFANSMTAQQYTRLDDKTMSDIDSVINSQMSQLTGLGVGIIYDGAIAYTNGYGIAKQGGVAFGDHTQVVIASISKVITGIMAMQLVQGGDLGLDDPVNDYVSGSSFSGMTVRHLLTHQSGIDHYNSCPSGYNGAWDPSGSLPLVQGCNVCMTPPGSGTLYTTQGFTLLGVIIDEIADDLYNSSFTEWYDDEIKDPANIITMQPAFDDNHPLLADGYDSSGSLLPGGWSDIGWKLPAGGFISNVIDLTRFAEGILNNTFISNSTLATMSQVDNPSGGASFACNGPDGITSGLAFRVHTVGSSTRIWHNGLNDHGFSTLLYIYPNEDAAIVLIANEYEETGLLWTLRQMLEPFVLCPEDRVFTSAIGFSKPGYFTCQDEIEVAAFTSWSSGTVTMDAGNVVRLKAGTTIGTGKSFVAKTDGCQ